MKVEIKNRRPDTKPQVDAVYLLHQSESVILVQVNTTEKYPKIDLIGGSSIILSDGTEVQFNDLPFAKNEICCEADRSTIYVTLFDSKLLHQLSYDTQPGQVLYYKED
jgi:hypothetical protein